MQLISKYLALNRPDCSSIDHTAFPVAEPPPFVEISHHVHGMNLGHAHAAVAGRTVSMHHGDAGPIKCVGYGMDASGEVNVLGIHEKAFVEQPGVPEGVVAQEHETPLMVRYVGCPVTAH